MSISGMCCAFCHNRVPLRGAFTLKSDKGKDHESAWFGVHLCLM